MWLNLIPMLVGKVADSVFPDKVKIAEAISKSEQKTSAAEIQDLMSGSSKWRKWVAFGAMLHFLVYTSLYHLIPQALHLMKKDDYYTVMETDIHAHSMYISAGIVVISMVGREILKIVRAIKG